MRLKLPQAIQEQQQKHLLGSMHKQRELLVHVQHKICTIHKTLDFTVLRTMSCLTIMHKQGCMRLPLIAFPMTV